MTSRKSTRGSLRSRARPVSEEGCVSLPRAGGSAATRQKSCPRPAGGGAALPGFHSNTLPPCTLICAWGLCTCVGGMHVFTCVHLCACGMCLCVHVCALVWVCMCIWCVCTCVHMWVCMCLHTCMCIVWVAMHVCAPACVHTCGGCTCVECACMCMWSLRYSRPGPVHSHARSSLCHQPRAAALAVECEGAQDLWVPVSPPICVQGGYEPVSQAGTWRSSASISG